jgi:uncharacterized protein YkwD
MLGLWTHRIPALAAALIAAALVVGSSSAAPRQADPFLASVATCPGSAGTDGTSADQITEMACLVDFARAQDGASTLHESKTLDRAASLKIDADIRCGQFSHTPCSQQFASVFAAAGYPMSGGYAIGENLAFGQSRAGSPRQIMADWLASPPHRENLLSGQWKSFGLGVRESTFLGYSGVALWANEFGSR